MHARWTQNTYGKTQCKLCITLFPNSNTNAYEAPLGARNIQLDSKLPDQFKTYTKALDTIQQYAWLKLIRETDKPSQTMTASSQAVDSSQTGRFPAPDRSTSEGGFAVCFAGQTANQFKTCHVLD